MKDVRDTRVVVAMSGGVDSSVAAALLVEQGYEVIGVMMRLWSEETTAAGAHNRCCTPDQMSDARRIADRLGIPFYVLDTKSTFRTTVVQFFIEQHREGNTPNPCIECNRQIRFDFLLNNALALDADYLATGHYARIQRDIEGNYRLLKGVDEAKDQSYVLSVMGQAQLGRTLFPVGSLPKAEVRRIAERFGLPTASKKDSQDLCFLGDGDYRRFLREHAPDVMTPGPIMKTTGEIVGEHRGLANYTIGQRRGLGVDSREPLYVVRMSIEDNRLVVGASNELGNLALTARRVNWVSGKTPASAFHAEVKIRYKAKPVPALVEPMDNGRIRVQFDEPVRGVTPGQGAVVYEGDVCLGGGIIERQPNQVGR
ncbi:MAG: tRNA 2-thiouridine(34) synthase MnmA [Anaerolineae bacterium]|nr:tRNA 2-thiouridine(34) synthase MnmA [Anaerolineae bacterium]